MAKILKGANLVQLPAQSKKSTTHITNKAHKFQLTESKNELANYKKHYSFCERKKRKKEIFFFFFMKQSIKVIASADLTRLFASFGSILETNTSTEIDIKNKKLKKTISKTDPK